MKIELNISERWGAINVLVGITQGKLKELKIVKAALMQLQITEKEKKEYGIEVRGQTIIWKKESEKKSKEFDVDGELTTILKTKLQFLNDNNALKSEMIDIADKLGVE